MTCRVGIGFDVHAFAATAERPLVLGGVHFENETSLSGHSDADVVIHAIVDALLGASGNGDIGTHFSDTDARWARVDSGVFALHTVDLLRGANYVIDNIDCTVVAERPNIGKKRALMVSRLQELFGAPVNVKATTAEGMGAIGRAEGIACYAVVHITDKSA